MPKQRPRLMCSGLASRVYVVTRYKELGDGLIEAIEKFDVTDDFVAALPPKGTIAMSYAPARLAGALRAVLLAAETLNHSDHTGRRYLAVDVIERVIDEALGLTPE